MSNRNLTGVGEYLPFVSLRIRFAHNQIEGAMDAVGFAQVLFLYLMSDVASRIVAGRD